MTLVYLTSSLVFTRRLDKIQKPTYTAPSFSQVLTFRNRTAVWLTKTAEERGVDARKHASKTWRFGEEKLKQEDEERSKAYPLSKRD